MLGGINNLLFLKGFAGFLVFPVFIFILRWAFPTKKDKAGQARRKALKKSLRGVRRK
jgi:hypothetical protein